MSNKLKSFEESQSKIIFDGESSYGAFEIKKDMRAIRYLKESILSLAYWLHVNQGKNVYLVLVDPKITDNRLQKEWEAVWNVLNEQISSRLNIITFKKGKFKGLPKNPPEEVEQSIAKLISGQKKVGKRLKRPDYFFVVLKVLMLSWIQKKGPVTVKSLGETAGCSYPTVAKTLNQLEGVVKRYSDRKIELSRFPRDAWARLLSVLDNARVTTRFADRSGKPRSPKALLKRLQNLERTDIAVGGTIGSRHWYPNIDLHGDPRLDLSIHCPNDNLDLDFVKKLDPALKESKNPSEPATFVVHVVRRKKAMFEHYSDGITWADPIECLLDLQEMRFEQQASEFIHFFNTSRKNI